MEKLFIQFPAVSTTVAVIGLIVMSLYIFLVCRRRHQFRLKVQEFERQWNAYQECSQVLEKVYRLDCVGYGMNKFLSKRRCTRAGQEIAFLTYPSFEMLKSYLVFLERKNKELTGVMFECNKVLESAPFPDNHQLVEIQLFKTLKESKKLQDLIKLFQVFVFQRERMEAY